MIGYDLVGGGDGRSTGYMIESASGPKLSYEAMRATGFFWQGILSRHGE
jgi:hypothetical protein